MNALPAGYSLLSFVETMTSRWRLKWAMGQLNWNKRRPPTKSKNEAIDQSSSTKLN